MFVIFHNPKCSKSRQTLKLLQEHTEEIEIREYLKDVPSQEELSELAAKLGRSPEQFLRSKEAIIKEENIDLSSETAILNAMVNYPKIIERPIVVKGDQAIIGRPPETVRELF